MDTGEAIRIKTAVLPELRGIPGVRMVGVGFKVVGGVRTRTISLRVFVERKIAASELPASALVPSEYSGLPTDVEVCGKISVLAAPADPIPDEVLKRQHRPLVAGVKIGNTRVDRVIDDVTKEIVTQHGGAEGTLGCFVRTTNPPQRICALTNAHVVNPSHLGQEMRERPGRDLYQPEPFLGAAGRPLPDDQAPKEECWCGCQSQQETRRIGRIVRAKCSAAVDAALIALKGGTEYEQQLLDDDGVITGTSGKVPILGSRKKVPPASHVFEIGETVFKVGERTGTTKGTIIDMEVTSLDPVVDPVGQFRDAPTGAFFVEPDPDPDFQRFMLRGDSGSVLIGTDRKVVGLLWGSNTVETLPGKPHVITKSLGVADPIDVVEAEMQCEVLTHDPGDPTQEVDGDNLDGVPHIDEKGDPVTETAGVAERAELVLGELRQRPAGPMIAAIADRAVREVSEILHTNTRARRVWIHHFGPRLAWEFLDGMSDLRNPIPARVSGHPTEVLFERLSAALSPLGSPELRRGLAVTLDVLRQHEAPRFSDVIESLEATAWPASP